MLLPERLGASIPERKRHSTFHNLWLSINWSDQVIIAVVLTRHQLPIVYALLQQRWIRCLEHVHRMVDGKIPKVPLYGDVVSTKRERERRHLRLNDVCERDVRAMVIDIERWEDVANDHPRSWSRRGETKVFQRGEACSRYRTQCDVECELLHMHW